MNKDKASADFVTKPWTILTIAAMKFNDTDIQLHEGIMAMSQTPKIDKLEE